MDISLSDLLEANEKCKVDRNYKRHKYDDCYDGYCMYLKHPTRDDYSIMVGIHSDGFMYIGDGCNNNLELEDTIGIVREMFFYGEWIRYKSDNLYKKGE
jgi:hypothetical protein